MTPCHQHDVLIDCSTTAEHAAAQFRRVSNSSTTVRGTAPHFPDPAGAREGIAALAPYAASAWIAIFDTHEPTTVERSRYARTFAAVSASLPAESDAFQWPGPSGADRAPWCVMVRTVVLSR